MLISGPQPPGRGPPWTGPPRTARIKKKKFLKRRRKKPTLKNFWLIFLLIYFYIQICDAHIAKMRIVAVT